MILQKDFELVGGLLGEGQEAIELVFEMEIERAVANTGLARNILRARLVIAALDKQLARRGHQLAAAFKLAPRGTRHTALRLPGNGRLHLFVISQDGRFCGFSGPGTRFLRDHGESVAPK